MFVLIIGITIVVTNKAYGRKPDVIDPIKPLLPTMFAKLPLYKPISQRNDLFFIPVAQFNG